MRNNLQSMQLRKVMRLEWLEDILAVLDSGSFHVAAETRFVTPSAFTRRIKTIEEYLGCELFDRTRKPIILRDHALDAAPQMREAITTLKNLRMVLSMPDAGNDDQIRLICQHTLTATIAPTLVRSLSKEYDINSRIKSGTKNECLLDLIKRNVEFSLTYEALGENTSIEDEHCEKILLGNESFIPVANLSFNPKLETLLNENQVPVVIYPSSEFLGYWQRNQIFSRIDPSIQFKTVAEIGLGPAVVEFVKQGIGVGWLPKSVVENEIKNGKLTNLDDWLPAFTLRIMLMRLAGTKPKVTDRFWSALKHGVSNNTHDL